MSALKVTETKEFKTIQFPFFNENIVWAQVRHDFLLDVFNGNGRMDFVVDFNDSASLSMFEDIAVSNFSCGEWFDCGSRSFGFSRGF